MWLVTLSRCVNVLLGGRYECLCSRALRRGWWRFVLLADAYFLWMRGEQDHCARIAEWEQIVLRRVNVSAKSPAL